MLQSHFSNHAQHVCRILSLAKKSIHIAICWFTHPDIFEVLVRQCRNGVQVVVALNYDQQNFSPKGLNFNYLQRLGGEIFGYLKDNLLHHKFAIIDGDVLIVGSFNWTKSKQLDHIIISNVPGSVEDFRLAFKDILAQCKPLIELKDTPPRISILNQLFEPAIKHNTELRKRVSLGASIWIVTLKKGDTLIWQQWQQNQVHVLKHPETHFWQISPFWNRLAFKNWIQKLKPKGGLLLNRYCLSAKHGDIILVLQSKSEIAMGVGIITGDPEQGNETQVGYQRSMQWVALPVNTQMQGIQVAAKVDFRKYKGSGLQLLDQLYPPKTPQT
jgi:hypothetical protein